MTKWAGLAWDIGTCTVTTYVDGELVGQVSRYSGAGGAPYQVHSPYGFRSRPADPDSDGVGAQALYAIEGNEGHVWFLSDSRDDDKVPKLDKGGSVQHNALGSFDVFANKADTKDGTKTIYVPVEFDGAGKATKAHAVTIGLDGNGKRSVTILHADGMRISMLEGDKNSVVIANKANDAWVEVNDDGICLNGNVKISGNLGTGPLATAWFTAVTAALTGLGASPGPPPISLTA